MALITCACGVTSRLPQLPKGKLRCAKCHHVFNPAELASAKPEAAKPFHLEEDPDDQDPDDQDGRSTWSYNRRRDADWDEDNKW